ncbi:AraC family transcriptional regulator ligand-binding domain-containing protein [Kitasatospora sp. NPDC096147]|uniref:AraC family transcriptional regulator ligand-binding domain-containing protein n=1 Tax=Kitasatospora sp. NPDC096147 TaxID=3364093 RepID=UPI00382D8597
MPSPPHAGTTPSAFTRVNAGCAALLGVDREQYARQLGMAPEHLAGDRYRTPSATNIRIWQLMATQVHWTEAASAMTEHSRPGAFGVWDYLLTSAATPLDGLRDAAEHVGAIADVGSEALRITEQDDRIVISHANEADLTDETAAAIRAFAAGLLRRRLSEAAQRDLVPLRVALATRAPRSHRALHGLYGTTAVEFEAPISSISFAAADLRAVNPRTQPGLSALLRAHAERSVTEAVPLHGWLDVFRIAVGAVLREGGPTLAAVAQRLAIGPRTLQRRLDEHGTSWRAELQSARCARVLDLLRSTELSLEAIAARTGYADARALRRAVRQWSGRSPSALRSTDGPGDRP